MLLIYLKKKNINSCFNLQKCKTDVEIKLENIISSAPVQNINSTFQSKNM